MLLAVHCKKGDQLDLKDPLLTFIRATYSDHQAQDATEDLAVVQQLRNDVVGLTGTLPDLRETLGRYYKALTVMETRFPISKDREHVMLSFTWYDAFRASKRAEQYSIHFEKAAVMFNIGAVLTQQALACDRTQDQGMKDAAKRFQEAAGAFANLRDVASLRVEQPRPVDISPECASMLERLCLAQAQECIFEKARADSKSPAILARLTKQVSAFYDDVLRLLSSPPLNAHFDKSWTSHVQVKATLYDVESQIQQSAQLHKDDDIAPEIARLKEAHKSLLLVKGQSKQCGKELVDTIKLSEEVLSKALTKAERENATVYLQRVPAFSDLPDIQPYILVKSLPLTDIDAADETLFQTVIPDTSAKALSKYTEMVDQVIRQQKDRLEAASDEARLRLREWDMPEALQALDAGSAAALPDGLRAELEQLEDHGGVRHLHDLCTQIKDLRRVAIDELKKVESALDKESKEDAELREKYSSRWNRPASAALNSSMREKIAGYNSNLVAAGDSDARLEQRLMKDNAAFAALSIDAAVAQMPRLQAPMVSVGDEEPAMVVANLRKALAEIDELSAERASIEEALKEERNRDNILPKLMASSGRSDNIFTEELKKYDELKADVDRNVARQAELLGIINKNTAAYRQAFGFREWRQACEGAASGMRSKVALFVEVRDNFSEGLRFYMSLQEAISHLAQQVGDYSMTRQIQRDDLVEDLDRSTSSASHQMSQMNLNPPGYGAQPPPPHNYPPPAYQAPPQAPQPHAQAQQSAYSQAPNAHHYPPPTPQYYHQQPPPQNPYGQPQYSAPPQQQQQQQQYGAYASQQYGQQPQQYQPPQPPQHQQQQAYYNPYAQQGATPPAQTQGNPLWGNK